MSRAQRVIVLFWDGMRADHVRPDLTPNLHRLATSGAWYRQAAGTFPSVTHPNVTTLSTGAYPGKHGIYGNVLPGTPDDRRPVFTNDREDLERLRIVHGGRILPVQTLAEALAEAGKKVVTMGSGPLGHGVLFDPERVATAIHTRFTWPDSLMATVTERFGAVPEKVVSEQATDEWLVGVLLGYVLPELEPDVVLMYCNEPDTTQHARGIGAPETLAVIRGNDDRLGRILSAVDESGIPTAVLVVSDHGHSTITDFVDLKRALQQDGFGESLAEGRLIYGDFDNDLVVESKPGATALARKLGIWMAERPQIDAIFSFSHDTDAALPDAIPVQKLWNDHLHTGFATAPTFLHAYTWSTDTNAKGFPGSSLSRVIESAGFKRMPGKIVGFPNQLVSMHGSLSPYDLNITLALAGAGIQHLGALDVPAGIVDVAPTVLALLDLPPLPDADGRALTEAFDNGPEIGAVAVRTEAIASLRSGSLRRRWVGSTAYLDTRGGAHPYNDDLRVD